MIQKSVLYLMQQPPYLDTRVFEAFDALLVAAAFEQRVSLLFRGAGVTQLRTEQAPQQQRNLAKILLSLEAYGISNIYADKHDYMRMGLTESNCVLTPTLLTAVQASELINRQDIVLND